MRLAHVVMREDDGNFSVNPTYENARRGNVSYILTSEQLPDFEEWFIGVNGLDYPFYRIPLKHLGKLFFICGIVSIAPAFFISAFRVIHQDQGVLLVIEALTRMALLSFVLALPIIVYEKRKLHRRIETTFPFPNAPRVVWGEDDFSRWYERARSLEPRTNIFIWFACCMILFALYFFILGLFTPDVPDSDLFRYIDYMVSGVTMVVGTAFLSPHYFAGRAFKKKYGKPRTPKNLYLSVLGRLNGAD